MRESRIIKILEAMGSKQIYSDGENVKGSCPLASWTHSKGSDRRPSFGVLISESSPSKYNCFSCKARGSDIRSLVWRYQELSGKTLPDDILAWLNEGEVAELDVRGSDSIYDIYPEQRPKETLPEEWLGPFKGSVPRYVLNRGISLDTCRMWELGHDKERRRVVFPVRDEDGELVAIMARDIHYRGSGPKYVAHTGVKKGRHFYGENMAVAGEMIVVVEGPLDALHAWECGVRDVVGVMGSYLTKDQARTLVAWDKPVYLFFDNDLAGIQGMISAIESLRGRVPVFVAKFQGSYGDVAEYPKDDLFKALEMAELADVWVEEAKRRVAILKRGKKGAAKDG